MFSVSCQPAFPAYYLLDIENEGTTLILHFPNAIWVPITELLHTTPYKTQLQKSLYIPDFIIPGVLPWGFGPVLQERIKYSDDWMSLRCELPKFVNSAGEFCEEAWDRAFGLVASIHLLLECAQSVHHTTPLVGLRSQLIEIMVAAYESSGHRYCAISAGLSDEACNWIARQKSNENHRGITNHMINAYKRLFGKSELDSWDVHETNANIRPQCSISFSVPGDRTGIGTYTNRRQPHGIEMYDHNVDSPLQQLVLLIGLASLCHHIRLGM